MVVLRMYALPGGASSRFQASSRFELFFDDLVNDRPTDLEIEQALLNLTGALRLTQIRLNNKLKHNYVLFIADC